MSAEFWDGAVAGFAGAWMLALSAAVLLDARREAAAKAKFDAAAERWFQKGK